MKVVTVARRRTATLLSLFLLALLASCASVSGPDGEGAEALSAYQATYQAWMDVERVDDSPLIADLEREYADIVALGPNAFAASHPEIAKSLSAFEKADAELKAAREAGQEVEALSETQSAAQEMLFATLVKDLFEDTLEAQKRYTISGDGAIRNSQDRLIAGAKVKMFYSYRGCGWTWKLGTLEAVSGTNGGFAFSKQRNALFLCTGQTKDVAMYAYSQGEYSSRRGALEMRPGNRYFDFGIVSLNQKLDLDISNVEFRWSDKRVDTEIWRYTRPDPDVRYTRAHIYFPIKFDIGAYPNINVRCHVELKDQNGRSVSHNGRSGDGAQCGRPFSVNIYPKSKLKSRSGHLEPGTYTPQLWMTVWTGEQKLLATGSPITIYYAEDYKDPNDDGAGGGNNGGDDDGSNDIDPPPPPPTAPSDDTCLDENNVPIPCLIPLPNQ